MEQVVRPIPLPRERIEARGVVEQDIERARKSLDECYAGLKADGLLVARG